MKIDRSKVRKANSDVPADCQKVIQHLRDCSEANLLAELKQIDVWFFGKCELYHWIDVLDRFDDLLGQIASPVAGKKWVFEYDCLGDKFSPEDAALKRELVHHILKFTALLIEHSYARHLYNSAEHLINLLDCGDGSVVLSVLNLIYVFSKRSNYLARIGNERRKALQDRLFHLGESWGGSGGKYTLDQCCSGRSSLEKLYRNAGNLYFEYYKEKKSEDATVAVKDGVTITQLCSIQLNNLRELSSNPGEVMEKLMETHDIPEDVKISLFYRLRLSHAITSEENCLQFVQARLQAISILIYSNATDLINPLIYDGLIEEIVNTLEVSDSSGRLAEVKACCLKTLTAIIHLDRNPRLSTVIENTGASSYHGFLPTLVRQCISHMTSSNFSDFPQPYATALFSFLYHLASYESGCEALVSSGLMESLLKVVQWQGGDDNITFVTRAVRVIDLITNLDMASFQTHNGLSILTRRLEGEVKICRQYHGPILDVSEEVQGTDTTQDGTFVDAATPDGSTQDTVVKFTTPPCAEIDMQEPSSSCGRGGGPFLQNQCLPQRAALLKSILNFLKKAIPDPAFSDATRSLMDESLQTSLKYIISNAEYYGALLFLLATDVVTVYIFHEPSMLSTLQDSGLTAIVLKALVVKDVPATRENLASLPNTLSALCLNNRGLNAFVTCKPFERLFRILISPEYLPAMKRRRSSDPHGDTAMHLGSAMDELMRHQPTLKSSAMKAIIKLIDELVELGHDPNLIAFHPTDKSLPTNKQPESPLVSAGSTEEPMSDEDMEEDFRAMVNRKAEGKSSVSEQQRVAGAKRTYMPLSEYLLNVTKFLENILCNNGTDDHCGEFVRLGGLTSLMKLFSLSNLPVEFPLLPACQSVSSVCKSIVVLSQENRVLKEGLTQLDTLLDQLNPLCSPKKVKGSVLLHELASSEKPGVAMHDARQTPLLHAMAATDAFVNMFVQICRGSQSNIRAMSVNKWSSDLGIKVLKKLSTLYTRLVWESSVLLSLCTPVAEDNEQFQFAVDDLKRLVPAVDNRDIEMKRDDEEAEKPDKASGMSVPRQRQLKLIRWLLASSSHLGRALAELFGLLVHQCVGSPRSRRHLHNINPPTVPTFPARLIATQLIKLLVQGLSWDCPSEVTVPRIRLTFFICAVGFAGPIFFDDKKNSYHILLQQFRMCGGLEHLKDLFDKILKQYVEYSSCPETANKYDGDIAEFLESWLNLVEKMVNTKAVLESPHSLPSQSSSPGFVPFVPVEFLTKVHTLAFHAMESLWNLNIVKHNNGQIAGKMLNIICHILKGEAVIREELQKTTEGQSKSVPPKSKPEPNTLYTTTAARSTDPEVNAVYMQQLMDMGFSVDHVREALIQSGNNLDQAMDYVLSTPPPAGGRPREVGMDVDASEEDMMIRAIALSLGENLMAQEDHQEGSSNDKGNSLEAMPQPKEALDQFTSVLFQMCLKLQDDVPNTVFGIHDLLIVACNRNGKEWRDDVLDELTQQINASTKQLLEQISLHASENVDLLMILCHSSNAVTLANRLHLFVLMAQDLPHCSAVAIQKLEIISSFIQVMDVCLTEMRRLKTGKDTPPTPRWLALMILLLDQYQKTAVSWQRKKTQECSHVWRWFDDRSGRWCNYSVSNNTSIDTAYHSGDASVRFTAGRRHYIVLFRVMVQINEDTGNRRPIMLHVTSKQAGDSEAKEEGADRKILEKNTKIGKARKRSASAVASGSGEASTEVSSNDLDEPLVHVEGLNAHQIEAVVRICTDLIGIPADANTLNSTLRILLRLTRDFNMATLFAERGGATALLQLTEKSFFNGFYPIVTLLIRHAMEDQKTLKHTLEKVIVSTVTHGHGNITCGVGQSSIGARELHYILRTLTPAACRSPELFSDTFKKLVRIQLPSQLRRGQGEDQELSIPPYSPQITRIEASNKSVVCPGQHPVMESIIIALLDHLVELYYTEFLVLKSKEASKGQDAKKAEAESDPDTGPEVTNSISQQQANLIRRLTGEAVHESTTGYIESVARLIAAVGDDLSSVLTGTSGQSQVSSAASSNKDATKDSSGSPSGSNPDKRLLSLQTLLKLLAEIVKTYSPAAKLVCKHIYPFMEDDPARRFQGSALAFIMDYLLPEASESDGSSISSLARALLAVISSCSQIVGVQVTLVSELKSSLTRALQLPECKEKHSRLQALFNLIVTIIEASSPQTLSRNQTPQGLGIIKLFIKRGIVIDLAKTAHSLDLSSPNLVSTINSMLKPLEKLSNMAAHQAFGSKADTKEQNKGGDEDPSQCVIADIHSSTQEGSGTSVVPRETVSREGPSNGEHADDNARMMTTESQNTPPEQPGNTSINDLESIVQQMLRPQDGGPRILGETILNRRSNDNSGVVEGSILIERRVDDDSDSGSSSDSSSDDITDGMSDGRDEDDTSEEDHADGDDGNDSAGEEVQSDEEDEEDTQNHMEGGSEVVMINFGGLESSINTTGLADQSQVTEGEEDEQAVAREEDVDLHEDIDADETFVLDDEDNEEDEGDADDENDEQDDEGNDEEGSEMDADDNLDVIEDPVVFGEEEFDPFTGDVDAGASIEISFPRRPYAVNFPLPRILEEEAQSSSGGRGGLLQHPLLSQPQGDNDSNASGGNPRLSRARSALHTERSRHHQNHTVHTFHVHSQGTNVARVLVGDDVRFFTRNMDGGFSDDLFIDVLGDTTSNIGSPQHSVPNALSRWSVESKLLDGMSAHECINVLKPDIVEYLEKFQEKELAEKKEIDAKAQKEAKSKAEKSDAVSTAGVAPSVLAPGIDSTTSIDSTSTTPTGEACVEGSGVTVVESVRHAVPHASENMDAEAIEIMQADNVSRMDNMVTPTGIDVDIVLPPGGRTFSALDGQPISAPTVPFDDASSITPPVSTGRTSMETSVIVSAGHIEHVQSPLGMQVSPPSRGYEALQMSVATTSDGRNIPNHSEIANDGVVLSTGMDSAGQMASGSQHREDSDRSTTLFSLGEGQRMQAAALAADLAAAIISQLSTTTSTPVTSGAVTSTTNAHPTAVDLSSNTREGEQLYSSDQNILSSILQQASTTQEERVQPMPGSTIEQSINAQRSIEQTGARSTQASTETFSGQTQSGAVVNEPGLSGQAQAAVSEVDGVTLPEGVDPSFLAALPDNIREEVLRDHLGILTRTTEPTPAPTNTAPMEVSPEFLAALPPEVQEEVLEQQRLEQARFLALQQPPDQPVDPAAFIRNLTPGLRRQVLADVDDSVLAVLPPDLSTEAQGLRREVEQRQQYFQERISLSRSSDPAAVFSQLFRNTGLTSQRVGGGSAQLAHLTRLAGHSGWGIRSNPTDGSSKKIAGRQLLDYESLACLLVLLFIDEPKLNTSRLHRVLRNLCYHNGTKVWIIQALISILRRTSGIYKCGPCLQRPFNQMEGSSTRWHLPGGSYKHSKKHRGYTTPLDCYCEELSGDSVDMDRPDKTNCYWLSRSLDSSLGHRVNLFEFHVKAKGSSEGKFGDGRTSTVGIHPQASTFVCKHTLDTLSFLAKNFAANFCPYTSKDSKSADATRELQKSCTDERDTGPDFWEILGLLDLSNSKKGKLPIRLPKDILDPVDDSYTFDSSPLGQILSMLSHPVIRRNTSLTDKLLRLLAVVSLSLPELPKTESDKERPAEHRMTTSSLPDQPLIPSSDEIRTGPTDGDDVLRHQGSEGQQSFHTVTFADFDTVVGGSTEVSAIQGASGVGSSGLPCDDGEPPSAFSETASVASSLVVEGSVEGSEMLPSGVRSPRAESVLSVYSDGTVAHSDISAPTTEGHVEPMEIDHVCHPTSDTSSTGTRSSPVPIPVLLGSEKDPIVIETQLRLAVGVLTSGTCSEDGLEDATTLLLQLSRIDPHTRETILALLMEGARELAYSLCEEIKELYTELKAYNLENAHNKNGTSVTKGKQPVSSLIHTSVARSQPWRGRGGRGSFGANRRITSTLTGIQRSSLPKPIIYDLHLPSMAALTVKKSSQNLLLRVLKVIIQLREAAKKSASKSAVAKPSDTQSRGLRLIERLNTNRGSLSEVVAALEADVEAMYEMIDRFGGRRRRQLGGSNRQQAQGTQSSEQTEQESNVVQEMQRDTTEATAAQADPSQGDREGSSSSQQDPAVPGTSTKDTLTSSADTADLPLLMFPRLSSQLVLDELWDVLGECLSELGETSDANAVLVLQPAVEAFFLVHGSEKDENKDKNAVQKQTPQLQSQASIASIEMPHSPGPVSPGAGLSPSRHGSVSSVIVDLPPDTQKFLKFAETHRLVLNQILRQSTTPLGEGPFAVLVNHTRLLDFDVKRRYFRQELEKIDKGVRREDMAVHVRREHVFEDSYRELHRKSPEEMKNRLYIVFDGEEGQDAGGLLREWYQIIAREMFNPNYALFSTSQGEKATYLPNRNSHCNPNHLSYFKFVGRVAAKAIYDNKLIDCYFTRSFYKHILGKSVHFTDMEAEDYSFYQGLVYLLQHDINDLGYELTFSVEVPVFGLNEIHDLKANGRNIPVVEETKREYVKLVCQEKMTGSIRQQIDSFLSGFYEIIPKRLISIFDEQELELLIAGLPTIDIEDLRANTEYHKYDANSLQIQWFWRALRSFDQADRAKFLQFVTGTSKVPLQGFSALEGMNGPQKFQIHRDDRSTDRLPSAHTCFNQLDLPAYETYDKLHAQLLKAIHECPEGFGLA